MFDPNFLNLYTGAENFDKGTGGVAHQVVFLDGVALIKIKDLAFSSKLATVVGSIWVRNLGYTPISACVRLL